jgi:hypothetical protein
VEIAISALVLGIMGSFHCAGMCGPIALSLPLRGDNTFQRVYGGLLYNIGRSLMYGVMGAIFGLIGEGFRMVGFQRWISVIMGSLMIASVLLPLIFRRAGSVINEPLTRRLRDSIGRLFALKSYKGLFMIGVLNALLPCGLVYMAIAGAIGTGSLLQSTLFMVLFGLGTIPMMLTISLIGNAISLTVRKKINRIIPVLVVVIGLIFILRGLSLGIPYLSPPAEKMNPEVHMNGGMKHK